MHTMSLVTACKLFNTTSEYFAAHELYTSQYTSLFMLIASIHVKMTVTVKASMMTVFTGH